MKSKAGKKSLGTRLAKPRLVLFFDDFGRFLIFVITAEKSFFRPWKAFLGWFEIHWTYNS